MVFNKKPSHYLHITPIFSDLSNKPEDCSFPAVVDSYLAGYFSLSSEGSLIRQDCVPELAIPIWLELDSIVNKLPQIRVSEITLTERIRRFFPDIMQVQRREIAHTFLIYRSTYQRGTLCIYEDGSLAIPKTEFHILNHASERLLQKHAPRQEMRA